MVDPCFVASECSCKLPALCRDFEPLTCFRSILDRRAEAANLWHPFWGIWNGRAAETIGRRRRGDGAGHNLPSKQSWLEFGITVASDFSLKLESHATVIPNFSCRDRDMCGFEILPGPRIEGAIVGSFSKMAELWPSARHEFTVCVFEYAGG